MKIPNENKYRIIRIVRLLQRANYVKTISDYANCDVGATFFLPIRC